MFKWLNDNSHKLDEGLSAKRQTKLVRLIRWADFAIFSIFTYSVETETSNGYCVQYWSRLRLQPIYGFTANELEALDRGTITCLP